MGVHALECRLVRRVRPADVTRKTTLVGERLCA
jgi:hypothetical protein